MLVSGITGNIIIQKSDYPKNRKLDNSARTSLTQRASVTSMSNSEKHSYLSLAVGSSIYCYTVTDRFSTHVLA